MLVNFHKMHGTLNDFLVFHDPADMVNLLSEQVTRLCNRRSGVGADGVIVVRPSKHGDFFMDYRNSDGSFAEMCGNGIRCLGKYVYDNGLTDQKELLVETRAGARNLELFTGLDGKVESVRVNMGPPLFDPQDIPASIEATHIPIVDHLFEVCGRRFLASLVSMGNPHCVILYDGDIRGLPTTYGPSIESLPIFPEKTNVEFVSTVNRNVVMMRVWERGSGETFACGTGACAAAVVTILKGLTDTPVTVQLLGGELQIEWKGQNADVFMMGPAVTVYDGVITI